MKKREVEPRREWHELVQIAEYMFAAMRNAAWKNQAGKPQLNGPTWNMFQSMSQYQTWKRENNV